MYVCIFFPLASLLKLWVIAFSGLSFPGSELWDFPSKSECGQDCLRSVKISITFLSTKFSLRDKLCWDQYQICLTLPFLPSMHTILQDGAAVDLPCIIIHSFAHSLNQSFIHSSTHSLTHSSLSVPCKCHCADTAGKSWGPTDGNVGSSLRLRSLKCTAIKGSPFNLRMEAYLMFKRACPICTF